VDRRRQAEQGEEEVSGPVLDYKAPTPLPPDHGPAVPRSAAVLALLFSLCGVAVPLVGLVAQSGTVMLRGMALSIFTFPFGIASTYLNRNHHTLAGASAIVLVLNGLSVLVGIWLVFVHGLC
jgi:cytochrome b561